MSIRAKTSYLVECDYPGCGGLYDFWSLTEEYAIGTVIDDDEWLCLFTGDNEPRFFCPLHVRYAQNSQYDRLPVFYDSDSPDTQPTLHALRRFYEDMGAAQPLPKLECEDTILDILQNEN